MRVDKFTYAQVESCLYEAMRTYIKGGKVQADREGNALLYVEMTKHNETFVNDCLKPIKEQQALRKKTKDGVKYYRKNEDGVLVEYQRGQAIADYHNSQVKSKLQKARMTGSDKQLSKAMGFILTLPKDYIQEIIPNLSDNEYDYIVKKLEAEQMHQPFKIDEVYENVLKEKFGRHKWTDEEMVRAKEFLMKGFESVLEEMRVRKEDVLFYSIHFDESFPHIHAMVLPTVEKTYEQDVYSKKKKKDGSYTLLHKKGDVDISYSVSQYYEQNKEGEYTFFKDFHQNIVKRMEDKGIDASGLINGITSGKKFTPAQMNHKQREESVKQSMQILALQKKLKQLEVEKTQAEDKANTCEEQVAKATRELEELQDTLEEKEIELSEKVAQVESLKDVIKDLKKELASLVKEVALFVPNVIKAFIKGWKEAKTITQMKKIDQCAQDEAIAGANQMTQHLKELGSRAEALLEEDEVVNGVNMATFNQSPQKIGFAKNQILKSAGLCGKAEAFADNRVLAFALQDWFDKDKHRNNLSNMSELEASLYMKAPNRAARAVEYALGKIEEIEMDMELD